MTKTRQAYRWNRLEEPDAAKVAELSQQLNDLNPALTAVLIQRGVDTFEKAKDFFRPDLDKLHDPFLMKDMDKAAERLNKAIDNNEKILVFGDYDVDGTTAVSTMCLFMRDVQAQFDFYIPDRYAEGYGVSEKGIRYAAENDFHLVVTLDCGIKAHDRVELANELGLDVIICDHHTPDDTLPPALAVLDQKREDCTYPDANLCGCGVGFKLIQAVCQLRNLPKETAYNYLDLVAVAVCADIVPMVGENRILASKGIEKLNDDPTPGLKALIEHAQYKNNKLNVTDIVFGIAPRINAAGRMESGATAVRLLMHMDENRALEEGSALNGHNLDRRELDQSITAEALSIIQKEHLEDRKTTVLYSPNWHKGVIGIVASRVMETYYRPTIILTKSNGHVAGSARSVSGFNVYDAIDACSDLLIQFGGHKYAAGLTMEEANVPAFVEKFEEVVSSTIPEELLTPEIKIDHELAFDDIDFKFHRVQEQLSPFGPANMRPVFSSKDVLIKYAPKIVGNDHLKLTLFQPGSDKFLNAIGFGMGHYLPEIGEGVPMEIAYTIDENTWNGQTTLQLKLKDIRF